MKSAANCRFGVSRSTKGCKGSLKAPVTMAQFAVLILYRAKIPFVAVNWHFEDHVKLLGGTR
jgi:hypothetical protein